MADAIDDGNVPEVSFIVTVIDYSNADALTGRVAAIEPVYAALGEHLARERRRRGITQDAVARELRLPRTAVSNIEKGCQRLLVHTLLGYAHALNLRPADLLAALEPGGEPVTSLPQAVTRRPLEARDTQFILDLVQSCDAQKGRQRP